MIKSAANFTDCSKYPTKIFSDSMIPAHVKPGAEVEINQLNNPIAERINFCFAGKVSLNNIEIRDCDFLDPIASNAISRIYMSNSKATAINVCVLESDNSEIEYSTFYRLEAKNSFIKDSDIVSGNIQDATASQVATNHLFIYSDNKKQITLTSTSANEIIIHNKGESLTIGSETDPIICSGSIKITNDASTPRHINSVEALSHCVFDPKFKPFPIPPAHTLPMRPDKHASSNHLGIITSVGIVGACTIIGLYKLYQLMKPRSDIAREQESEMVNLNTAPNNSSALVPEQAV
ncbi:MAG: hypothetical protein V4629_10170 [Pseudomonadota bacterium]